MIKSRTIFIGDVQGCYAELKLLINKLNLQKNDRVFFAGDIIDKGPRSHKVLKYIYKNKDQFRCIKGNCEVNFLEFLEGDITKESKNFRKLKRKIEEKETHHLIEYIKAMPLYIEEENFILVHAGIIPNKKLINHTKNEITNTTDFEGKPWYELYNLDKTVIYGHWAKDGIQIRQKTKGLDSGCVYGKALSAYILETGELIQQTAINSYIDTRDNEITLISKIFDIFNSQKGN